jgi:hypothetical protein
MVKRQCLADPDTFVYLDDRERRVIATATLMPSGGFLVYGPQDAILRAGSEREADRIAERFGFAL